MTGTLVGAAGVGVVSAAVGAAGVGVGCDMNVCVCVVVSGVVAPVGGVVFLWLSSWI